MRRLAAVLALAACHSSKPYAPSEYTAGVGYAWNNTVGAPSLDHEGPVVWFTSTWVVASGRKTQESIWSLDDKMGTLIRKEQDQTDQLIASNEMRKEELMTKGILQEVGPSEAGTTTVVVDNREWTDALFDFGEGPLGLPIVMWAVLAYLLLGVGRKYLGLPLPIPGFAPKNNDGNDHHHHHGHGSSE